MAWHDSLTAPIRRWWSSWTQRNVSLLEDGASTGATYPAPATYPVQASMASYARFVWVTASAQRISEDISGLPLKVRLVLPGNQTEPLDSHEVLELLKNPNARQTRVELERQVLVDLKLSGNAYLRVMRVIPGGKPAGLARLHPEETVPLADDIGIPMAYRHTPSETGTPEIIPCEDVIHVRMPSYAKGRKAAQGMGIIEPLHLPLTGDHRAQKLNATASKTGVPAVVIYPDESTSTWASPMRRAVSDRYDEVSQKGGALVLSGKAKVDQLKPVLRDIEFSEGRKMTREEILAGMGTPPVKVGLPTANYATSENQLRIYWEGNLALVALLDAGLTRLAREWDARLEVYHDASAVAVLQESRTERLGRVGMHILNGMSISDAYAYEGFDDAPVPDAVEDADDPDTATDELEDGLKAFASFLVDEPASRDIPTDEAGRSSLWAKGFVEDVHRPNERRLVHGLARYQAQAGRRYADALLLAAEKLDLPMDEALTEKAVGDGRPVYVVKDVTSDLLEALLGGGSEAEIKHLTDAVLSLVLRAVKAGWSWGESKLTAASMTFDPAASEHAGITASTAGHVARTNERAVARVVERGIANGASIREIQRDIRAATAFGFGKALERGRTLTTAAVGSGTRQAAGQAIAEHGLDIRLQWLSARDGNVRAAHQALDGQEVVPGTDFVVPAGVEHAGARGPGPGEFADAGMVANCRCAVLPVEASTDDEG